MPFKRTYRGYEISDDITVNVVKPNTDTTFFEVHYEESIQDAFHKWVDDQLKLKCSSCESEIMKGDWFLDGVDDHQFCTIACACKFNHEFHTPGVLFAPVLTECHDV